MEKIKSASDFATQLKECWYDAKFKFQDCVALIEERDRQIFDLARKQNNWGEFKLGSTKDLYPEGIKNEE